MPYNAEQTEGTNPTTVTVKEGGNFEENNGFLSAKSQIILKKSAHLEDSNSNFIIDVGDKIYYEFNVTNVGNVALSSVIINDDKIEEVVCPKDTLAVGESIICTGEYQITADDIKRGKVENIAMVVALNPFGEEISDMSDDPKDKTNKDLDGNGEGDDPTITLLDSSSMEAYTVHTDSSVCIGDYVWFDENLNGIQDENETGVVGVKVSLTYKDGSKVTNANGDIVDFIKTDANGKYEFCNLVPNKDYVISFELPETYMPTVSNKGDDDTKDSDANEEAVIEVTPSKDDFSLDLGIYCECNDYTVNSKEYKDLHAPSFNLIGIISMSLILITLVRRKNK